MRTPGDILALLRDYGFHTKPTATNKKAIILNGFIICHYASASMANGLLDTITVLTSIERSCYLSRLQSGVIILRYVSSISEIIDIRKRVGRRHLMRRQIAREIKHQRHQYRVKRGIIRKAIESMPDDEFDGLHQGVGIDDMISSGQIPVDADYFDVIDTLAWMQKNR